jgi:hypothetical protein
MEKKSVLSFGNILTLLFFLASMAFFFSNQLHSPIRRMLSPGEKTILSVATGQVIPNSEPQKIVKIQTPKGLRIEIYDGHAGNENQLLNAVELPGRKDAYFQFQGRASNLALQDRDGDRVFEIISPSTDQYRNPQVDIIRYNLATGNFESVLE